MAIASRCVKYISMGPALLGSALILAACAAPSQYMGIDLASPAVSSEVHRLAQRAQAGDKHAQLELGIRFEEGDGVERDLKKAKKLYQQAASDSGGTIWVYSPPVGNGTSGRVIPVDTGAKQVGLDEARGHLLQHRDGNLQYVQPAVSRRPLSSPETDEEADFPEPGFETEVSLIQELLTSSDIEIEPLLSFLSVRHPNSTRIETIDCSSFSGTRVLESSTTGENCPKGKTIKIYRFGTEPGSALHLSCQSASDFRKISVSSEIRGPVELRPPSHVLRNDGTVEFINSLPGTEIKFLHEAFGLHLSFLGPALCLHNIRVAVQTD